jgi:hypothetical protein
MNTETPTTAPLKGTSTGQARRISALLAKAGFPRATFDRGKYLLTKGFGVSVVGCSNKVSVHWFAGLTFGADRDREESRERQKAMREYLEGQGIAPDSTGCYVCEYNTEGVKRFTR